MIVIKIKNWIYEKRILRKRITELEKEIESKNQVIYCRSRLIEPFIASNSKDTDNKSRIISRLRNDLLEQMAIVEYYKTLVPDCTPSFDTLDGLEKEVFFERIKDFF